MEQFASLSAISAQDRTDVKVDLAEAPASGEADAEFEALQRLVQMDQADEKTVLSALEQALMGEDLTVKSYAIHVLVKVGGPATLESLRQALYDPNPDIRLLVVEQLSWQDHIHPLLQEALAHDDEAVRFLATTVVEQPAWNEGQGRSSVSPIDESLSSRQW
jgi:HEAT repeat protein